MARFDSLIDTAARLIEKNGREVFIRRDTGTTFIDPTKEWLGTTPNEVDTCVKGVFFETTLMEALIRLGSGRETPVRSNVEEEGALCLIAAKGLTFEIDTSMKILVDGDLKEILKAEPLRPNDQTIIYTLRVKS